jgi:hypothetical protein
MRTCWFSTSRSHIPILCIRNPSSFYRLGLRPSHFLGSLMLRQTALCCLLLLQSTVHRMKSCISVSSFLPWKPGNLSTRWPVTSTTQIPKYKDEFCLIKPSSHSERPLQLCLRHRRVESSWVGFGRSPGVLNLCQETLNAKLASGLEGRKMRETIQLKPGKYGSERWLKLLFWLREERWQQLGAKCGVSCKFAVRNFEPACPCLTSAVNIICDVMCCTSEVQVSHVSVFLV